MIGVIGYLLLGGLYMLGEFKLFLDDAGFEADDPFLLKVLYTVQLANHLGRVLVVWPSYALEDFILWVARVHDNSGDIDDPQ